VRRSTLAIAGLLVLVAAAPAAAQPRKEPSAADKQAAEDKLREAAAQYDRGDRLGAVRTFEEAYALYPAPVILYNLGKAYRGVGRNALAHRTLSRFLHEAKKIKPAQKTEVDQALRDLETVIGLVDVEVSLAGVIVTIDGDEVGTSPLPGPVAVEPGVHLIAAQRDGHPLGSQQAAVGTSKRVKVSLDLAGAGGDDLVRPAGGGDHGGGAVVPPPDVTAGHAGGGGGAAGDADPLALRRDDRRDGGGSTPLYKKWWLWAAIGVVAVASVAVIATRDGGTINDIDPSLGSFDF